MAGHVAPWTELDPLKRTANINFAQGRLAKGAMNAEARDILRDLTQLRGQMLDVMARTTNSMDDVQKAFNEYFTLLRGLIDPPADATAADDTASPDAAEANAADARAADGGAVAARRLGYAVNFKWTDNTAHDTQAQEDARFELASAEMNLALWHAHHAWTLSEQEQRVSTDTDDVAKEIYKSLLFAAGVMQHLLDSRRAKAEYTPNTDLDERFLHATALQYGCEAQEVTIERARSKGHNPKLIAAIAANTHLRYAEAENALATMDLPSMRALRAYLQFKAKFYLAYTYTYLGQQLFAEEQCGDSLKAYQQAQTALTEADAMGKAYKKATVSRWAYHSAGPLTACDHIVFKTLGKTLREVADKSRRENDFIYYHKVPADDIPMPESRAMAKPVEFALPTTSETWRMAKFSTKKIPKKGDDIAADKAAADEAPVSRSALHPDEKEKKPRKTTETYCAIS